MKQIQTESVKSLRYLMHWPSLHCAPDTVLTSNFLLNDHNFSNTYKHIRYMCT